MAKMESLYRILCPLLAMAPIFALLAIGGQAYLGLMLVGCIWPGVVLGYEGYLEHPGLVEDFPWRLESRKARAGRKKEAQAGGRPLPRYCNCGIHQPDVHT